MNRVALITGYAVMGMGGLIVIAFISAVIMRLFWIHVVRPAHLMADYQEWRRAKASGAWRWPRVTSEADEVLK